jgi:N-acetylmuramoyl-L-alanine amidase
MCWDCSPPERMSRRSLLLGGPVLLTPLLLGDLAQAGGPRNVDAICRKAWGARSPRGNFVRHNIHRLTVHHSGAVLRRNREAPSRFRSMQQGHFSEGWPDIAYHILVDRHGNVYRARPTWAKGNTRTNYNPRGHLLVMCIGNFNVQEVPRRQLRGLINVLTWACTRFDVRPRTIGGHREYAATACPGDNLQRLISNGKIRRRVRARLDRGVDLDRLCGRAGRRRVRAIERGDD